MVPEVTALDGLQARIREDVKLGYLEKKTGDTLTWYISTYYRYKELEQLNQAFEDAILLLEFDPKTITNPYKKLYE